MLNKELKATCKRCNKPAPVNQFVLDHVYRMMVCQNCVKERRTSENVQRALKEEKAQKEAQTSARPPGWDAEDDYLERSYAQKKRISGTVERLSDEKMRYSCPVCRNSFIYNTVKKYPSSCPFCDAQVYILKTQ